MDLDLSLEIADLDNATVGGAPAPPAGNEVVDNVGGGGTIVDNVGGGGDIQDA